MLMDVVDYYYCFYYFYRNLVKKQRIDFGMGGIKRILVNFISGNSFSALVSKSIIQFV